MTRIAIDPVRPVGRLDRKVFGGVREATRWARAIRMLDPRAKLVSCGMNGWNEWDRVVIDGMASLVDYHPGRLQTAARRRGALGGTR